MKRVITLALAIVLVSLTLAGCQSTDVVKSGQSPPRDSLQKVEFGVDGLDDRGLRGPIDGKRAVAYEFAIPNTEQCRAEVRSIDRTVEFMCGSRGRIGAGKDECLCIGSTHQEDFRDVLRALSELPYIERIIECHFE